MTVPTGLQAGVLDALACVGPDEAPPTAAEIAEHVGGSSPRGVADALRRMARHGWVVNLGTSATNARCWAITNDGDRALHTVTSTDPQGAAVTDRTDTEVAVDLLRAYAAGGKDRPGRPAARYVVEHIDQLETHAADARLDAEGWQARYEAMRSVARRYRDGFAPNPAGTRWEKYRAGSMLAPPEVASITPDVRRALDELEADRGQ